MSSTALCSVAQVTMWRPPPAWASATPLMARLSLSVAPLVKTISLALAPMSAATSLARRLDRLLRLPAVGVAAARRVAEALGEPRQHRLEHPRIERRRRVVVHVDRTRHRPRPLRADRAPASPLRSCDRLVHGGSQVSRDVRGADARDVAGLLRDLAAPSCRPPGSPARSASSRSRSRRLRADLEPVDEPQIVDVDGDLRVVDLLERVDDLLAQRLFVDRLARRVAAPAVGLGHDLLGLDLPVHAQPDATLFTSHRSILFTFRSSMSSCAFSCAASLGRDRLALPSSAACERVPGQRRALDAHRELGHAGEDRELVRASSSSASDLALHHRHEARRTSRAPPRGSCP